MRGWVNVWVNEWVSEWMRECVKEQENAWVNAWMNECVSQRVCGWVSECVSTWMRDWIGFHRPVVWYNKFPITNGFHKMDSGDSEIWTLLLTSLTNFYQITPNRAWLVLRSSIFKWPSLYTIPGFDQITDMANTHSPWSRLPRHAVIWSCPLVYAYNLYIFSSNASWTYAYFAAITWLSEINKLPWSMQLRTSSVMLQ